MAACGGKPEQCNGGDGQKNRSLAVAARSRSKLGCFHRLLYSDWQLDFERSRPEAHLVVTGLITKLARDATGTDRSRGRRRKLGTNIESPREYQQALSTNLNLFGFGKAHGFRLQRTIPRQLERNEEFVSRVIAIYVEAGKDFDFEIFGRGRATL